jgi:acetoin utilization protein AcuB
MFAQPTLGVAEPADCGTAPRMDKTAPIAQYMTPMPHTVGSEQTITFAQELMQKYDIRHLPVLHGGELYGIVSDRDLGIVAGLNEVDPDATTVEEAMTQEAYTVSKEASLFDVLEEMLEHKYGSAIVVEGVKIVGILTTHDALKLLVDKFATV